MNRAMLSRPCYRAVCIGASRREPPCSDGSLTSKSAPEATEAAAATMSGSAENFCCDSSAVSFRRAPWRRRVNFPTSTSTGGCSSERLIFGRWAAGAGCRRWLLGTGLPVWTVPVLARAIRVPVALRGDRSSAAASARTLPSELGRWREDITGSRMRCFLRLSAPRPKSTAEKGGSLPEVQHSSHRG